MEHTDRHSRTTLRRNPGQRGATRSKHHVRQINQLPAMEKLNITRFCAPEPPRHMRNLPKFYAAKGMRPRRLPKFDIIDPGPYRRLWRRGNAPEKMPPEKAFVALREMPAMRKLKHPQEKNTSNKKGQTMKQPRKGDIRPSRHGRNTLIPFG